MGKNKQPQITTDIAKKKYQLFLTPGADFDAY